MPAMIGPINFHKLCGAKMSEVVKMVDGQRLMIEVCAGSLYEPETRLSPPAIFLMCTIFATLIPIVTWY